MMELMESTMSPEAAPFSLDLGLDRIRPAAQRTELEVHYIVAFSMHPLQQSKIAAPAYSCALIAQHHFAGS